MTTRDYTPGVLRPMPEKDPWGLWDVSSGSVDPTIRLIHPLSPEFHVAESGRSRPRVWAVEERLMLVTGVANCAHGLYAMDHCPAGCGHHNGLDHTSVWAQTTGEEPVPFVLTQPYAMEIPSKMFAYASCHGLNAEVWWGNGWHGARTLPIRLTMKCATSRAWPLQAKIAQLLALYPPRWDGAEEALDASAESTTN